MAALRKFKHRGLTVEVWKTSFRITSPSGDTTSQVLWIGKDVPSDEAIRKMIDPIFEAVETEAKRQARQKVVQSATRFVEQAIDEGD